MVRSAEKAVAAEEVALFDSIGVAGGALGARMGLPDEAVLLPQKVEFLCGCGGVEDVAVGREGFVEGLRAGAFDCALSISSSNSGMPDAARVASGPGEIA